MNIKEIKLAAAMAARFIALSKEIKEIKSATGGGYGWIESGAASGALRRASLDLTRQLAVMRRAG